MAAIIHPRRKRSLETMTPEARIARAKKPSTAAAAKRTEKRLEVERAQQGKDSRIFRGYAHSRSVSFKF